MAKRAYTQHLYDRLVEGFREKPGNASHAARFAGCERRCAARAWEHGWPRRPWAIPIRLYLEQEREMIRAERAKAIEERAKLDEAQREKARQDAVDTLTQEALASRASRINSIALSNMISKMLPSLIHVSEKISAGIKNGTYNFTPHQALKIMGTASYVVRQANEAVRLALEIERVRVGDPNDGFKIEVEDMGPDEVVTQLMGMTRTLRRARKDPMNHESETLVDSINGRYPEEEVETIELNLH